MDECIFLGHHAHCEQIKNTWFRAASQGGGGLSLRVEVNQEHTFALEDQSMREGDSRGGLAHAAFLIGNANDFGGHYGSASAVFSVPTGVQ
jgi:hypothetical protein